MSEKKNTGFSLRMDMATAMENRGTMYMTD